MLCTRCMVCSPEMTDERKHRAGHEPARKLRDEGEGKRPSGTSRLGPARQPWRLQQRLRPGLRRGRRTRCSPGQEARGIPQTSCTKEGVEIRRKAPTLFGNSVGSEHLAAPVFLRLSRITASPIKIDGEVNARRVLPSEHIAQSSRLTRCKQASIRPCAWGAQTAQSSNSCIDFVRARVVPGLDTS